MEIEHALIDGTNVVIQLIRSVCPLCNHPVEFIIPKQDRLYEKELEYTKKKLVYAIEENDRLRKIIDKLVEKE